MCFNFTYMGQYFQRYFSLKTNQCFDYYNNCFESFSYSLYFMDFARYFQNYCYHHQHSYQGLQLLLFLVSYYFKNLADYSITIVMEVTFKEHQLELGRWHLIQPEFPSFSS